MRDQKPTIEEVYIFARTKKQFHQLLIHTNADPLPRAKWQREEEKNRDPIVLRAHAQNAARPSEQYMSQLRKEYTIRPP